MSANGHTPRVVCSLADLFAVPEVVVARSSQRSEIGAEVPITGFMAVPKKNPIKPTGTKKMITVSGRECRNCHALPPPTIPVRYSDLDMKDRPLV